MSAPRLGQALERLASGPGWPSSNLCPTQRRLLLRKSSRKQFSTSLSRSEETIRAAPAIDFDNYESRGGGVRKPSARAPLMQRVRVVPASPSYFSGKPVFMDALLELRTLLRRHEGLPLTENPPQVAFKTLDQYHAGVTEAVDDHRYKMLLDILQRLNRIHPDMRPADITAAIEKHKRAINPYENRPKPHFVDEWGRALGVGHRKSSTAKAYVVEGEGQCIVNGRNLAEYFGRVHDRESALWALKVTERLDRYNVWVLASGGGITGQAEAMLLAVAKALCVLEPELEPRLRFAGALMRDPRKVERKKPGHVKARKMPTWVKR